MAALNLPIPNHSNASRSPYVSASTSTNLYAPRPPGSEGTMETLIRSLSSSIVPGSRWVIQTRYDGQFNVNGQFLTSNPAMQIPGSSYPMYALFCYTSKDGVPLLRLAHSIAGELTPDKLITFLQRCITHPSAPHTSCIPNEIILPSELQGFHRDLSYFFHNFPSTFTWKFHGPEETRSSEELAKLKTLFNGEMERARALKSDGNAAYQENDYMKAADAFYAAGNCVKDLLEENLEEKDVAVARRLLAECYANRAALWLLPGSFKNLRRCVEDAEKAEKSDPSYSKSYIRLARAYQGLGQFDKALDTLARALSRDDLMDDEALAQCLIIMQNDARDLSNDPEEFKNWKEKVLSRDPPSAMRMKRIPATGAWYKLVEQHAATLAHG
ncbi:hypothetical protein GYMLUDRAFT_35938 [Collybiopsis luxurians FD-317 M1]|nr:hypothetical protein GYMLUDRAFT_35938 [Collybiopsis luxurians FD-317 M1]